MLTDEHTTRARPGPTPRDGDDRTITDVLHHGDVSSVFQPIVDLDTGATVAFEALARGPVGDLHSPLAMFDAARAAGRLGDLDRMCRAAALRGASEHQISAPLTLFVNVEPEALDGALPVAAAVDDSLRVMVEITERDLVSRPAELLRTVEQVRALGWGIALDDVGVETASLAFMPLLRPDVVKIDLSLVQDAPTSAAAQVMHAVNAYAESSGALVLAEGIETAAHVEAALALGATLGQGWHFGRPSASPVVPATSVHQVRLPNPAPNAAPTAPEPGSPFSCLPSTRALRRAPKRLLIELSKHLEREAVRIGPTSVIASTFQLSEHFTALTRLRYQQLVESTGFVMVIGQGLPAEPLPGVRGVSLAPTDPVLGEWDVAVLSPHFAAALLARDLGDDGPDLDRSFEYALTYDRDTVVAVMHQLLLRVSPR